MSGHRSRGRGELGLEAHEKMPNDDFHQFITVGGAGHHYDKNLLKEFIYPPVLWIKRFL